MIDIEAEESATTTMSDDDDDDDEEDEEEEDSDAASDMRDFHRRSQKTTKNSPPTKHQQRYPQHHHPRSRNRTINRGAKHLAILSFSFFLIWLIWLFFFECLFWVQKYFLLGRFFLALLGRYHQPTVVILPVFVCYTSH